MTEWLSTWRHVLVLWLVHTANTLQPLKEFKSLHDYDRRLVSAVSPDLPAANTLDGISVAGVVKSVADKEEVAFSRTSVEAPPDSLDTATFTKQIPTHLAYLLEESSPGQVFDRSHVEAGSQLAGQLSAQDFPRLSYQRNSVYPNNFGGPYTNFYRNVYAANNQNLGLYGATAQTQGYYGAAVPSHGYNGAAVNAQVYHGAAVNTQGYHGAAVPSHGYYGAAAFGQGFFNGAVPSQGYYGAAKGQSYGAAPDSLQYGKLSYYGAANERDADSESEAAAGLPTGVAPHPLREAVESRPPPFKPSLRLIKAALEKKKHLAHHRRNYMAQFNREFNQVRSGPQHGSPQTHEQTLYSTTEKGSVKQMKIVCYYGAWSVYRKEPFNFGVADIDPFSCTHLIYSFAGLDEKDLTIMSLDEEEDIVKGSYKSAVALKTQNPSLKVMLAIGGWNEGGKKYSQMAATAQSRRRFIDSTLGFLTEHGFDGLDLDWEYPGATDRDGAWGDRDNFAALVEELGAEFAPRGWLLSAAVSPAKFRVDEGYDVPRIVKHLDFVNVMTYDLHGDWDGFADHHAPLHAREHDSWEFKSLNTDGGLAYWRSQGAPLDKLLLGTPFYGRSFTLASAGQTAPGSRSSGPGLAGPFTDEKGFMAYYEICKLVKEGGWTEGKDSDGNFYIHKGDQWIGYDKVESVERKMRYVRSKGLGGAMIWAIDLDDYRGDCGTKWPLLATMNLILRPNGEPVEVDEPDAIEVGVDWPQTDEDGHGDLSLVPEDGFVCPQAGVFPSPTNCQVFYTCTGDLTAHRSSCADGTVYDPTIGSCNWPQLVNCNARRGPQQTLYLPLPQSTAGWPFQPTYLHLGLALPAQGLTYAQTAADATRLTYTQGSASQAGQPLTYYGAASSGEGNPCAGNDGVYSHPQFRDAYVWCFEQQKYEFKCPLGLFFDSATGECKPFSFSRYSPGQYSRIAALPHLQKLQHLPYQARAQNQQVLCYFANWAGLRPGDGHFVPENLDAARCTSVAYAFAKLDPNLLVPMPSGPETDIGDNFYGRFLATVRARNPSAKVLVSLGGWADSAGDKYSRLVNGPANIMADFVRGTVDFLESHGFDGVILEWLFPMCWQSDCSLGPSADREGFTRLLTELRKAFGTRYRLGVTLAGYRSVAEKAYDVAAVAQAVDFMNVMTYDYHGFWDGKMGHHAPLYDQENPEFSVDGILKYYESAGAPKDKLIMGLPAYGQSFTAKEGQLQDGGAAKGPGLAGPFTRQPGMLAYYEICPAAAGWTVQQPATQSHGPTATKPADNQWVGYDNPTMMRTKAQYVQAQGYAGASLSTLDLDDFTNACCEGANPLLGAVSEVLLGVTANPAGCGRPSPVSTPAPVNRGDTTPRYDDGSQSKATTGGWEVTAPQTTTTTTTTTTMRPSTTESNSQDDGQGRCVEGDYLPHGSDCQKFYRCVDEKRVLHSCAAGLFWNGAESRCDWAASVQCVQRDIFDNKNAAIIVGDEDIQPLEVEVVEVGVDPANLASQGDAVCTHNSAPYIPVVGDCTSFIQCVNGEPVRQSCSAGLHFSQEKNLCDWPEAAKCGGSSFLRQTGCQEGSFQADPANCGSYLMCVHGDFVRFNCQSGTHWDNNLRVCNHPELAGCQASSGGSNTEVVDNGSGWQGANEVDTGNNWEDTSNQVDNGGDWDSGQWSGDQWSGDNSGQWQPPTTSTRRPPGSTEAAPLQGPLSGDYKVVCYFTNWAWYRPGIGKYRPEDIDPTICTHIVYGFAVLDYSNLVMKPHDTWADLDNDFYFKVTEFKKYGIKVTIAIGGWNDSEGDKYSRLVNNPAARTKFIEQVIKFIEKHDFDGLDLDWEYPSCWQTECKEEHYKDKDAFAAFVRELRAAFTPRGLLLSAAVSPSKKIIDVGYDVPSIARDLDWIAVMTYDYHGHWDKKTGHVAPFYEHPDDDYNYFNTNYTINYWISSGAPRKKLVMGMPLYGQAFTLDSESVNGLNAPARQKGRAGEFTRADGFLAYYEICHSIKTEGWKVVQDPEGRMGPYAVGGRQWVSYDDVATIRRKSEFVREMGLGGGMVWALDLDDFKNRCGEGAHPLMKTIQAVLGPAIGQYAGTTDNKLVAGQDTVKSVPDTEEEEEVVVLVPAPATERPEVVTDNTAVATVDDKYPVEAATAESSKKVVCYFTNWAWYRPGEGKYTPDNIDPELCTHIVYGFAVLDNSKLVIRAHDSWADFDNEFYKKVTSLKTKGKKVLLALGGWNDSAGNKYSRLVNSPEARRNFIEHAVSFLEKHNFDGLDLDWEYPKCWQVDCTKGPASDKAAFASWVKELATAFRPRGLLVTAAVSPSNAVIDAGYDIPALAQYLDYVSVMTYDYHGQWDKKTGHVAPMYNHPMDDNEFFNVNYTVHYWLKGGLHPSKLILGVPLYGQSFTLASAAKNGLNDKTYGGGEAGKFTRARGFLAYYEICDLVQNKGWKVVLDPASTMGPYAYKGSQWVSFDDTAMVRHKMEYLKRLNLGGAMIWALDLDDFRNQCGCGEHPLLRTINTELGLVKGPAPQCDMVGNYRIMPGTGEVTETVELSASPYSQCPDGNLVGVAGACHQFKVCVNGEYVVNECPAGLHWNRDRCDWPDSSNCDGSGGGSSSDGSSSGDSTAGGGGSESTAVSVEVEDNHVEEGAASVGSTGLKVVCYFTNWAWYRQGVGKYTPDHIDPQLCTHVNYGFAVLDPNRLVMTPHDSWADIDNNFFTKVADLKKKGVTVSIALGGWNDSEGDKYSRLVNSPASRKTFITEAVKFIEKYGFEGLDLDWEYPKCWQVDCNQGPDSDKEGFAALVRELSEEFRPRGWSLSAAVSPSKTVIDAGYDVPALNKYLDIINVMTYDYHGHWDKKTGHVAPMYEHPEDDYNYFNANFTMNYWVEKGADKAKLVMGMPMYGQSFGLSSSGSGAAGLNAPAVGRGEAGVFTRAGGFLAYYEICHALKTEAGWSVVQDPEDRMGPYATKGNQWVGFDDIATIRRKSQFVKDNGFGGGMIWALDLDDFTNRCGCEKYPLLRTINRVLRDYSIPDPGCRDIPSSTRGGSPIVGMPYILPVGGHLERLVDNSGLLYPHDPFSAEARDGTDLTFLDSYLGAQKDQEELAGGVNKKLFWSPISPNYQYNSVHYG